MREYSSILRLKLSIRLFLPSWKKTSSSILLCYEESKLTFLMVYYFPVFRCLAWINLAKFKKNHYFFLIILWLFMWGHTLKWFFQRFAWIVLSIIILKQNKKKFVKNNTKLAQKGTIFRKFFTEFSSDKTFTSEDKFFVSGISFPLLNSIYL